MPNMKRARAIGQSMADQERSAATMEAAARRMEEREAVAPDGSRIVGTFERIPGCAEVVPGSWSRRETGELEFDYDGYTEVYWNDQRTLEHGQTGERLFVDEAGEIWRESQLHLVDADGDPAPGEAPKTGKPQSLTTCNLDEREAATVLAALRHWQRGLGDDVETSEVDDIATNGGTLEALSEAEIDALCERLNAGP